MLRIFILTLVIWLSAGLAQARETLPVDTGRTEISLLSDFDTVAPGQTFTVVLRMEFEGDWYTYWRNPGDSGEPVNIVWDLPDGFKAGPIQWPVPKTKWVGPFASYALDKETLLPVEITVPETIDNNVPITVEAQAYYLVCDDICVPENGALSLVMGIGEAEIDPNGQSVIEAALKKIPQKISAQGASSVEDGQLIFEAINLPSGFTPVEIFPHAQSVLVHNEPVEIMRGDKGVRFTGKPGYGWDDAKPEDFSAALVAANGDAFVVDFNVGERLNIGALATPKPKGSLGFLGAVIGAFLGGLILNLMPCVFPIISLKALSLAKTAHGERASVRRAGWAYVAGVLFSFVVFAIILIILKSLGTSIGWGFQLQSPWLVALLSLLLFAIGLNLLGMFDVGGRLQNIGNETVDRAGPFSSFLTGVLAVIVATPCTAPFMAGAVGYALASSAFVTIAIFLALGLGFALPFLLVAYAPGLLSRLPKPGAWMETFKQFLAFPMFAAAIWLAWVLSLQAGASGILKLLLGGLALAFAIWLFKRSRGVWKILAVMSMFAALFQPLSIKPENGAANLTSEAWSAERVRDLQAENRPIFVDFTAAWCVTCKVNEGLVLNTRKTKTLFDETDTAFLVADWTNKDDVIAEELARFGRAGVPLYLVYRPGVKEPEILPQVLTSGTLEDALKN